MGTRTIDGVSGPESVIVGMGIGAETMGAETPMVQESGDLLRWWGRAVPVNSGPMKGMICVGGAWKTMGKVIVQKKMCEIVGESLLTRLG